MLDDEASVLDDEASVLDDEASLGLVAIAASAAVAAAAAAAAEAATAAATATAEAAAATAAAATAEAPTTAATATAAALFLGTGLVHGESATAMLLAVETGDGCLSFLVRGHLDEPEAFATAGVAIADDLSADNLTVRAEKLLELGRIARIGQIAHVQLLTHDV